MCEKYLTLPKELRRKKHLTPKVFIFGEDGRKHCFFPTYDNPIVKMLEAATIRSICDKVNAKCVISVAEACDAPLDDSNLRPSQHPNRRDVFQFIMKTTQGNT